MAQSSAPARSHQLSYAMYGALFGLGFPIFSTIFDALYRFDALSTRAMWSAQRTSPLHWVIDTAPFFLGLFASFAGRRQDVIEAALAKLRVTNADLRVAHKKAEDANTELQAALDAKGQFLAKMSHELRTPLNVVIGFSRILLERSADKLEKRSQRHLQMVHESGQHLLNLVNDMLDIERIAAGRLKINKQPVDLCDATRKVHESLKPTADAAGYEFIVETPSAPLRIETDPDRLRQVITNLTNNAIKYAGKGRITLCVERGTGADDPVFVRVTDTGQGIPADQLDAIFQPFHQVDNTKARDKDGAGLGLNIVQRLVELLGGKVSVASSVGAGSTFTVELPASMVVSDNATAAAPADEATDPRVLVYDSDSGEHTLAPGAPRVLVIDDKRELLELIRHDLRAAGFRVDIAASGEAGLRAAREKRPDAIVLDIIMPGLDGWEVLRRLRADPDVSSTPVVISSMLDNEPRAAEFAVSAWLTKPFAADELERVLRRVQNKKGDVLVVEDDEATRELLRTSLAALDTPLRFAPTGAAALDEVDRSAPGAVVLDLGLPDISGFEVLRLLRERGHSTVPVIVYTGRTLSDDEAKQLKSGLAEVIEKHAARGPEGVVSLLKSALKRKA